MAQQADNIGGIQLPSPMQLAAEAAEAERQEHIEQAAQTSQQPKRQPRSKRVGEEQGDFGLSCKKKETRVAVALSFDPEMNERLTTASYKLKTTRSAILEQLFNQWWEKHGDKVKAIEE